MEGDAGGVPVDPYEKLTPDDDGCLPLTGGGQYNFTFSLADKTLKIDFENTAVSDSTYTVVFNDNGLTLTAVEGTVTPGKEYILNRQ